MSKIVVFIDAPHPPVALVRELRSATGQSVEQIRAALRSNVPIVERELFGNDHDDAARVLRETLMAGTRAHADVQLFELEPDEDFASVVPERRRIDVSTLHNILKSWDEMG